MSLTNWLRPQRHLLAIFLVIVLLPSTLLIVSGWRLMTREETLARQARQSQMADVVVAELRQRIASVTAQLSGPHAGVASMSDREDFVFVVFEGDEAVVTPSHRLAYYPVTRAGRDEPVAAIAEAQALRRLGKVDAALDAWARASRTRNASVVGVPVDLFARWAECDLLEHAGRERELKLKAASLHADLLSGRWQLNKTVFETHMEDAVRWAGVTGLQDANAYAPALSAAVADIWERWRTRPDSAVATNHELVTVDDRQLALFWRADSNRLAVFVASVPFIDTQWLSTLQKRAREQHLKISLHQPAAQIPDRDATRRVAAEMQLPWTVAVASIVPAGTLSGTRGFRIWVAGVVFLSLIVVAGTIVIARAAARELAVARLQSDFVSAVSHEFRTPLTSLRQIGEVLHDGRIQSDERRQTYYEALMRQTERLHHLVETLLDFGRMEAGRSPYQKVPLDLPSWARSIVAQFNREVAARGYTVELTAGSEPLHVIADPQALSNALWNLLDNAVKYSPACRTVWVTVDRIGHAAAVQVRDLGIGVPAAERRGIFGKFVRGAEAKSQNIPGTGIGLAMVQHIMKAHGGSVRVDSDPGHGSTFTLVIPCSAS